MSKWRKNTDTPSIKVWVNDLSDVAALEVVQQDNGMYSWYVDIGVTAASGGDELSLKAAKAKAEAVYEALKDL